jgi:neurotransmitter:Na+ symporter, NSS family
MSDNNKTQVTWSSRSAFLLASIGCAVGLGNLWRFPYVAGENGGGAFVLIYIGFVVVLGIPLIMSELAVGRAGKLSAVGTMIKMVKLGHSPFWKIIGWISILVPVLGLSYYSVVAGWSLDYIIKAAMGTFTNIDGVGSGALFQELQDDWPMLMVWFTLYMFSAVAVVSLGVKSGLESTVKIMMPALFVILIFLSFYAMVTGNAAEAFTFLINPDFSKITANAVLVALGQALFSLAIGVGALITYGAYLPDDVSLPRSAGIIAFADTIVALLAGFAIFPIVFQYGLTPGEGPGLIFATLPIAFGQMPGGIIFGTLFFVLLSFAAFTSSIGMLEPIIAWFEDKGLSRPKMAWVTGCVAWCIGMSALFSFNVLKDFKPLDFLGMFAGKNIFGILDFLVANILLPINALLLALFAGWALSRNIVLEQLGFKIGSKEYIAWHICTKYIAPISISIVIYSLVIGDPIVQFNQLMNWLLG